MWPVQLAAEAVDDLRGLKPNVQHVALQWLTRLRHDAMLGRPLRWRLGEEQRGARVIYFSRHDRPLHQDRPGDPGPTSYRIIYQVLPEENRPERVLVIAVAERGSRVQELGTSRPST